jgi:uncharacterized protein with FMN-binding domain
VNALTPVANTATPSPTPTSSKSITPNPTGSTVLAPTTTTVPATPTIAPTTNTAGAYKDGSYTGSQGNAYYGYVQVQAVISGGKLTDVQILSYPSDRRTSIQINNYALPQLKSEAIQAQSARINMVSGATDTSLAFIQSLTDALKSASN